MKIMQHIYLQSNDDSVVVFGDFSERNIAKKIPFKIVKNADLLMECLEESIFAMDTLAAFYASQGETDAKNKIDYITNKWKRVVKLAGGKGDKYGE